MKRLIKYLSYSKADCLLAPAFKLLEACLDLSVPIIVSRIIDRGIYGRDFSYVKSMVVLLFIFAVVSLISTSLGQYFSARAATDMSSRLRRDTYSHMLTLSHADRARLGDSAILSRLTTDINIIETTVNMFLRRIMRSPVIVAGAVVMAFLTDVYLAIIFAVLVPALFLVIYFVMRAGEPLFKKAQGYLDRLVCNLREILVGVRVIRAFGRQKDETKEFEKTNKNLSKAARRAANVSSLLNPLSFLLINSAIIALLYFGGVQVNIGDVSSGEVVALYNYMSQILIELINTASLVVMLSRQKVSVERVGEFLDTPPSISDGVLVSEEKDLSKPAVEFIDVSFRYKEGDGYVVKDLTFSVAPSEIVGIIGGTGAGKSTIVNMIPRLLDANEGEVKVFGRDVKEWKLESLRDSVGLVMQQKTLFKGTVRENVLMGRIAGDEEVWKALKAAQAKDFIEEKPGGLDFIIEKSGSNLSGGQKQRICIARALIKRSDILILDDSSSALDYATDKRLRDSIRHIKNRPATIIVSQRYASIADADKIIVIDEGEIAGIGSHRTLLEGCDVYKEIVKSQEMV